MAKREVKPTTTSHRNLGSGATVPMAKRDGWRVAKKSVHSFKIEKRAGFLDHWVRCYVVGDGRVSIDKAGYGALTPARARQFAAKVIEMAERAEREGKR